MLSVRSSSKAISESSLVDATLDQKLQAGEGLQQECHGVNFSQKKLVSEEDVYSGLERYG